MVMSVIARLSNTRSGKANERWSEHTVRWGSSRGTVGVRQNDPSFLDDIKEKMQASREKEASLPKVKAISIS